MRGADHEVPKEYSGTTPPHWSANDGEYYNLREVEYGGGWPTDDRPMWMRMGDVLARGALMLGSALIALVVAAWIIDRSS